MSRYIRYTLLGLAFALCMLNLGLRLWSFASLYFFGFSPEF